MSREKIVDIRPLIPSISQEGASSSSEIFQNTSLRPIIKLQHDLIIEVFRNYIQLRKRVFYQLDKDKKSTYIAEHIKKDKNLNSFLMGVIAGHFTLKEWNDFLFDEKDLKKRISNMLIQRLQDHVEEI